MICIQRLIERETKRMRANQTDKQTNRRKEKEEEEEDRGTREPTQHRA